jgi:HK97 family phage major capsid protein
MNLAEMKRKRSELLRKMEEIDEQAQAEGRELNDGELAVTEDLMSQAEELTNQIEQVEKAQSLRDRIGRLRDNVNTPAKSRSSQDYKPSSVVTREPITATPAFEQDPKCGYANDRDFMFEVLEVGSGRKQASDRLRFLAAVGSDEQSGIDDPHGGFLVPTGFSPNLMQVRTDANFITSRMMEIPMAVSKVDIPARVDKDHSTSVAGGLVVTRRPETVAPGSSRLKTELISLNASSLMGLSYVTEELLQDSPISVAALLAAGFSDAFNGQAVDEAINGTGAGEPLGYLNSGATIEVAKESGQAADTINYTNITKIRARVWGYGNSIWVANHDTLPQLMTMASADNAHIWQPSARDGEPDSLLGRPIVFTEFTPTLGDKGDISCVNMSQYLHGTLGSRTPNRAESIHVRFVNHERTFKFWLRNDGRPWWKTALTPKNGATLSPFVTLAERA